MKFRNWIRKTPAGRLVWRLFIGFIGGGITVFGAVLLVAPGPGVLVLLAGLGILATPGSFYGADGSQHIRIAMTATDEAIADASSRILAAVQG